MSTTATGLRCKRVGVAQSDDNFGCLLFLVLIPVGLYLAVSHGSWSNSLWYSVQYQVGFGDVQTDAKPDDCDFLRAPLGSKGCSYKAHVKVLNADGVQVAGEGAPMYGSDTKTAKPIISYDGGKNWNWYEGAVPSPKPKYVGVFWVKE
jgi:hypothetical protein